MTVNDPEFKVIVGICREDNPRDVDEAYGKGTYAKLFLCEGCEDAPRPDGERFCAECKAEVEKEHDLNWKFGDPASQYGGGWGF